MDKLRQIEVRMTLPQIKFKERGYFHLWSVEPFFDNSQNHYLSRTLALIEFEDGRVKFLEPEAIQFTEPYKVK